MKLIAQCELSCDIFTFLPEFQLDDLKFFIAILLMVNLAAGVFTESIQNPNASISWSLIWSVFYKPYWQMYGELFLDGYNGKIISRLYF